ncbi:MAG: dTDP-4-dehydrorhamnose 3,5-epimerase family protein [Saprospiraceae bacterium]|nr:dTDP-4-dehydrorhamnose 3,5-epimerase family protein [Saprospiraceae bacterium]
MKEQKRDIQTVTTEGKPVGLLPEGVTFKELSTQIDERGSVCELFDSRWDWHPDPLVFSYLFTVRPEMIKGWGMHMQHEDRYLLLLGEMEVVLYDAREDSPTNGLVAKVVLSEYNRRLMNIPAGIWHADHNIGQKEAFVVNFPTICYDHTNPDKYRLPVDTDQIPYSFVNPSGW